MAHTPYQPIPALLRHVANQQRMGMLYAVSPVKQQTRKHQKLNVHLTKVKVEACKAFHNTCGTLETSGMLWTSHKNFQRYDADGTLWGFISEVKYLASWPEHGIAKQIR